MAFVDHPQGDEEFNIFEDENKKRPSKNILLDVSQADNMSIAGGVAHSAFDFPLKKGREKM